LGQEGGEVLSEEPQKLEEKNTGHDPQILLGGIIMVCRNNKTKVTLKEL
jgi:hypothetical protein